MVPPKSAILAAKVSKMGPSLAFAVERRGRLQDLRVSPKAGRCLLRLVSSQGISDCLQSRRGVCGRASR